MLSGLDQREEAFAGAAKVSYMRPESDFEPTVMLTGRTIGYSSNPVGPNCRPDRRAIDNKSVVGIGFRQHVVCRHDCFFLCDTFLVQLPRRLLEKQIFAFNSKARQSDNPCSSLASQVGGCKSGTNE